jgi:beta-galactosidase/beta-glucuronidase
MRASEQDGSYPRPQLHRDDWVSLDGRWQFTYDDERRGRRELWFHPDQTAAFTKTIVVPFPPESPASGINDPSYHPVVWYRLVLGVWHLPPDNASQPSPTHRVLIHFGAVDHSCEVWFDGALVGSHIGGQTPFTVDVTHLIRPFADPHCLVVRVEDDPHDTAQPRGKQDWELRPHGIWYQRTTGIWQSVWLEVVPEQRIEDLAWLPRPTDASVRCELTLSHHPPQPVPVTIRLSLGDEQLCHLTIHMENSRTKVDLPIPAMANGQDRARFLWTPDHPALIDAEITLHDPDRNVLDTVTSYFGMRTTGVGRGHFLLNGQPCYVRSILGQGYWEESHLAAPSPEALREEVELAKAMGFNTIRVHQKAEDPRFLFHADRHGLMVWAETANAYEFSARAVELLTREWLQLVRRDRSHPCIVTWVPLNESWGVQDIATDRAQQHYSTALATLTRAIDPTRPVTSNEGWEHLDSDILGLHDYCTDPALIATRYGDPDVMATLDGRGALDRQPMLSKSQRDAYLSGNAPLMITEFGGIGFAGTDATWGYQEVASASEFAGRLRSLFDALRSCPSVAGFCYTQLADTAQETNGLATSDRKPKLPTALLAEIVEGSHKGRDAGSVTYGWIRTPRVEPS